MKELVLLKNVTVKKYKKNYLENVSLKFFEGVSVFLCGTSASGKTLLLKAIDNQVKYTGDIIKSVSDAVVFDESFFKATLLEDELRYVMLGSEEKDFVKQFFNVQLLKTNPNELSDYQKKVLSLCKALYKNPQIIFIDQIYSFLTSEDKEKFKQYFEKKKITVVVVSNDIEESLYYDYMIVLNEGMVALEGKTEQVLKEEKILKRLGIGLPFYVDLSLQLQCYGLIQKVYLNKEELVKQLWK